MDTAAVLARLLLALLILTALALLWNTVLNFMTLKAALFGFIAILVTLLLLWWLLVILFGKNK